MNFSFNEEQTLIQSQVAQFIKRDYEWEKRQALVESDLGFSADNWMTFADLGWFIGFPPEESYLPSASISMMPVHMRRHVRRL